MSGSRVSNWPTIAIGLGFAPLVAASGFLLFLGYAWATQPLGWESMSLKDYFTMFGPISATLLLGWTSWSFSKRGNTAMAAATLALAYLLAVIFAVVFVV